jgi:hypothetical protein
VRDVLRVQESPRKVSSRKVRREFHVLLSPTWRVPVLYFSAYWETTLEPLTLDQIYEFLVHDEDAMKEVSIMGGISHGVGSLCCCNY